MAAVSVKRSIEMRDYTDRRVTPPEQVISPTWGPHLYVNRPLVVKRRHRENSILSAHATLTCFIAIHLT